MVVLLAIAFLLSVNKEEDQPAYRWRGVSVTGRDWQHYAGYREERWVAEKVAFGVHKVMAYSAGSAFIFGSLVGPKMDTLFDGAGFIFGFKYYRQLSSSPRW